MQPFEWTFPTRVVFGLGRFKSTHRFVRGLGKRVFIVTSKSFLSGGARAAVLDELLAQLRKIGVEWQVFGDIEPNPRVTTVDRAAGVMREFRPRYVIALGGGSVMDAAKCLALLGENEGGIYQYAFRGLGQERTPFNNALPIVCIPTIAATSSETDFYAVVTNWETHKKVTVFGDSLKPTLAIIDPELTYSVPPAQSVEGGIDMITHVIESYLSTPAPAPIQDRMTEAIIETVVMALPRVLADARDELGRSQLSWCGALALSGVLSGRDGGWPVHALEHGLSAWNDMAHGRGLAMILPRVMKFDEPVIGEKLAHFNKKIFGVSSLEDGFFKFMRDVGAWTNLDDATLIEPIVDHALEMKGVWKRGDEPYIDNCRRMSRADLVQVMKDCLG